MCVVYLFVWKSMVLEGGGCEYVRDIVTVNIQWTQEEGMQSSLSGLKHRSSGSDWKESACNAGDPGSILGSGRSTGEGSGNPLQYSCLENPMDRGAWLSTVHGFTKSPTWLSIHTHTHAGTHACMRVRVHTHTHTHTPPYVYDSIPLLYTWK